MKHRLYSFILVKIGGAVLIFLRSIRICVAIKTAKNTSMGIELKWHYYPIFFLNIMAHNETCKKKLAKSAKCVGTLLSNTKVLPTPKK